MSRLTSRIEALKYRPQRLEPYPALKLPTTENLRWTLVLVEWLELPDASPWLVQRMAEAVINFYAQLEEHDDQPHHPDLRGAVRHLERLGEIEYGRLAPDTEALPRATKPPHGHLEVMNSGITGAEPLGE
jgi:hypothetical protein